MINAEIKKLVTYGVECGLIEKEDSIYITNQLLEVLGLEVYEEPEEEYRNVALEPVLKNLLDYAFEKGILKDNSTGMRDLFDTKLMGRLTPGPSTVIRRFRRLYEESPEKATDYFYKLCQDSDYIRRYRIAKDRKWVTATEYGEIEITINLAKPEKDPRAIAAARNAKADRYPKCQLCRENEGYAGRLDHPARQNHRIIPISIKNSPWGFQYSPYVYYNEHCIVLNEEHTPMQINRGTFEKLLDFVQQFPHYFVGSNADLPIVGGSILSHDHFQGGRHEFAMAKASVEQFYEIPSFEDIEVGIVKWPLSVIRLKSSSPGRIIALSDHILGKWRGYTDADSFVFACTESGPHNTITPIARKRGEFFEMDLVLRNNITTKEHPLGVFHPHENLHHIKKENIGLIEVMGLAVLPARLKEEMELLATAILEKQDIKNDGLLAKHADWVEEFLPEHPELSAETIDDILRQEVGGVFLKVLEDAGVYKRTAEGRMGFERFINSL